jgi:hypothetical protein
VDYISEIRKFHRDHVMPYRGLPIGCTENEVSSLESAVGYELPIAYKQFLLWMGKDYHGVFQGTDWFIDSVISNTKDVPNLLRFNKVEFQLPEHFLAFFGHQGYMYAWFELPKTDDNPCVWNFSEGETYDSVREEGHFTDFLFKDMQGLAASLTRTVLVSKAKSNDPRATSQ